MTEAWIAPASALAGIVVGWATSEFSARLGFTRQRHEQARLSQLAIARDILSAATTAAHEVREAVVISQFRMRQPTKVGVEDHNAMAGKANEARDQLRLAVAQMRIVGSPGSVITSAAAVRDRIDELFVLAVPLAGPLAQTVSHIDGVDTARDAALAEVDRFAVVVAAALSA